MNSEWINLDLRYSDFCSLMFLLEGDPILGLIVVRDAYKYQSDTTASDENLLQSLLKDVKPHSTWLMLINKVSVL